MEIVVPLGILDDDFDSVVDLFRGGEDSLWSFSWVGMSV
jgi:hypothetical protein